MIDELLPEKVSVAEVFGTPDGPGLFPEEAAIVASSVAKRRREFAVGRGCARRALAGLGLPAAPLLSGGRGEPLWPAGVVGAITHCDGYCAAVAAPDADIAALGVDAEPALPLPEGILDAVSLPEERAGLPNTAPDRPDVPWDRLLFSAKESVYKVWFPLTGQRLAFEDAAITFDPARGTFTSRLLVPGRRLGGTLLTRLTGRFVAREGLVLTAIAVPHPRATA